jgi:hypothetical protein
MTKKVLFTIMLLSAMGIQAQEIIKCSPEKTFWLIKDNGKDYAVTLHGAVEKANHPKLITVDGKNLQYLITDKKASAEKAGTNDDLGVLSRFVGDETTHLISQFGVSIEFQLELVLLPDERKAIYWHYNMPEGMNGEVQMQHFINVIEGDKIFGLASADFKGDDAAKTKQMLVDALGSLTVVKDSKKLCK